MVPLRSLSKRVILDSIRRFSPLLIRRGNVNLVIWMAEVFGLSQLLGSATFFADRVECFMHQALVLP